MIMTKNQEIDGNSRTKAFSSEKKTTIVHAFQVSSLPKKSNMNEKKGYIEE